MKQLKNLPAKDDTEVAEDKFENLILGAPRFNDGSDAVKNFILGRVLASAWPAFNPYTHKNAENSGVEDGEKNGDTFPFQADCRSAFRATRNRVGKAIAKIVKREKVEIDETLKLQLPNMEEQIERNIDRVAVTNLMKSAKTLNNAMKNANEFLRTRGYKQDSPEAQEGVEYMHWNFLAPLVVIFLFEVFANYWLLGDAEIAAKFRITAAAVAVVFIAGYAISWCIKARMGTRIINNKYMDLYKILARVGVAVIGLLFTIVLIFFIFYRAGIYPTSIADVFPGIANAFVNNITDIGLVLLNIVFLFIAIRTFLTSGWKIRKYGDVAKDIAQHQQHYDEIRGELDNQAKHVFTAAIAEVQHRQQRSDEIEMNWKTIVSVCKDIPDINKDATDRINEKYQLAIKKYREGFSKGRFPQSAITDDLLDQTPIGYHMSSPITLLVDTDDPADSLTSLLQHVCDVDFQKEISEFHKRVDEWKNANSEFDKLSEFAQQQIKKQKERIRRERNDDGIEVVAREGVQHVDV